MNEFAQEGQMASSLMEEARNEASLRRAIVGAMQRILGDPVADPVLKVLVVAGFLGIVGISFLFTAFLINAGCHLVDHGVWFEPIYYVAVIAATTLVLMGISIPLIVRGSSRGEAMRLKESFERVYAARIGGVVS